MPIGLTMAAGVGVGRRGSLLLPMFFPIRSMPPVGDAGAVFSRSAMLLRGMFLLVMLVLVLPAAGKGAKDYLKKPDEWFVSAEGRRVVANVLSWQAEPGGWPKNEDTAAKAYEGERGKLKGTFDNGATTDELRFLARAVGARLKTGRLKTQEKRGGSSTMDDTDGEDGKKLDGAVGADEEVLRAAFLKGLGHVLGAQYATGGWPQLFPPGKGYHRHITFNDNSMVRVMEFLREVSVSDRYAFVPVEPRRAAGVAFEKGVGCILKCQIVVDGKRTVWCAQHDEVDYRARDGRSFELASFSGSESVGIVRLLMSVEKPSPEVVAAVEGAVAWLEEAKIEGLRAERRRGADGEMRLVLEEDADAPAVWARFYDLETGKPFFCDRDGVKKASILEVAEERRGGYAWYGDWAGSLLEREYPRWRGRSAE